MTNEQAFYLPDKRAAWWQFIMFVGMSSASDAALYMIGNGTGALASGIQTHEGATFRDGTTAGSAFIGINGGTSAGPGVVALGIFSTDFISLLSENELIASFTVFGDVHAFNSGGNGGSRSIFSISEAGLVAGSIFENKFIYVFAGDGISFAESTQFWAVKTTVMFIAAQDNISTVNEIKVFPANTTLLYGSQAVDVRTTDSDPSVTNGWSMDGLVPEPSTFLLGAIGSLVLLGRRKMDSAF